MAKPIKIEIIGDDKSFGKAIGRVETGLGGLSKKVGAFAVAAGGAFAAAGIGKLGAEAVGLASDLGEAAGAAETIFGEGFQNLESTLSDSAKSMGINRVEALDLANGYGVLFGHLTDAERATATLDATARAADVGSMFNDDPAAVAAAFTSAINGSSETVRKYGIDTSDAALKQFALENGIGAAGEALTENEKKLIRHQIIMRDSEIAAGNFADTSGGLANQQRILSAQFDDVKIKLGEKLLPVVVSVAGFVLDNFLPTLERLGGYLEDTLGPVFNTVAGFIRDDLIPMFKGTSDTVDGDVSPIIQSLTDTFNNGLKPAFQSIVSFVKGDLLPVLDRLWALFKERIWPILEEFVIPTLLKFYEILYGKVLPVLLDVVAVILDQAITALETFFDTLEDAIVFVQNVIDVFDSMIATISGLPDRVRSAARGLWDGIPKPPSFITDGVGGVLGRIPGFAGGTDFAPGGLAVVGERGPELVNLPRGSQVIPNHQLGGAQIMVNVMEPAATAEHIAYQIGWAMRTGGVR